MNKTCFSTGLWEVIQIFYKNLPHFCPQNTAIRLTGKCNIIFISIQFKIFYCLNSKQMNWIKAMPIWILFRTRWIDHRFIGLVWFGLWCLTPLSTIFQLYDNGQFYWWGIPEYPDGRRKPSACCKSLTNFIDWYNFVSSTSRHERGSNSQL